MRVLFLTHFFPPEVGAPQTRILETAQNLRDLGHDVSVLTGFPNYPAGSIFPGYRGRVLMREIIGGIPVLRCWLAAAPNSGFARRTLAHVSLAATTLLAGVFLERRPDVIVVDQHPIFLCATAYAISRLRGSTYVLNAGDLIPEHPIALGLLTNPIAIALTRSLSHFVRRHASTVVTFSHGMGDVLGRSGVPRDRLHVLYYGANTAIFAARERWLPLPQAIQDATDGGFVVTYAGSHGVAQGLEVVLRAAERLRERQDIRFVLVGGGAEKEQLLAWAESRGLANVRFFDPLPHDAMPSFYERSSACLVCIRAEGFLASTTMPSKTFEIMAAGRAIVMVAGGEPAEVVEAAGAGVSVALGSDEELALALTRLAAEPQRLRSYGENGKRYVAAHVSREAISRRYEVGSSRVDLQACKLEYSIVSPK